MNWRAIALWNQGSREEREGSYRDLLATVREWREDAEFAGFRLVACRREPGYHIWVYEDPDGGGWCAEFLLVRD